jgi:(+)-trans-carveol dehydrogenase
MSSRFAGKVAFVTGAARGQGRSHAIRLAEEGADVIAIDICADIEQASMPMGTLEELQETASAVEALDRRVVTAVADVRDFDALRSAVDQGIAELGGIDVVVANAGIGGDTCPLWEVKEDVWDAVMDVNLKGVWNTVRAAVPTMIEAGNGGSIVITASAAGLKGYPSIGDYCASKHGVLGLMKVFSQELGEHSIRVNAVNPTNVNTKIFNNERIKKLFVPDADPSTLTDEEFDQAVRPMHLLPTGWVDPADITAAVVWLASDEARYVTGISLLVDAGHLNKV